MSEQAKISCMALKRDPKRTGRNQISGRAWVRGNKQHFRGFLQGSERSERLGRAKTVCGSS